MRILVIDTSLSACSVALTGHGKLVTRTEVAPRQQANHILPFIDQVLNESKISSDQLKAIAFTAGPGSFTGIRLAASVAQGLAFGLNIPLLPISTLRAMAQTAYTEYRASNVMVALDGQVGEIYWGHYQAIDGIMQAVAPDKRCKPMELGPVVISDGVGVGDGWSAYPALSQQIQHLKVIKPLSYPHIADIARLATTDSSKGLLVPSDAALPNYLHDASGWKKIQ